MIITERHITDYVIFIKSLQCHSPEQEYKPSEQPDVSSWRKISSEFLPYQVSTKRPQQGGCGTILQDAVTMGKLNFVQDLLEFG